MIFYKLFKNQEYFSYIIVLFFGLINFFFVQDPFESFFTNYDQEFWNTYNSLLIYSGLEQEKYDEPGHISYLLFAIYLKIINFFKIIDVPTIYIINEIENIPEKVEILISKRRKGDLVKIIASNNKLKKFIKWKPKFNNLNTIVKSCINWEKRQ